MWLLSSGEVHLICRKDWQQKIKAAKHNPTCSAPLCLIAANVHGCYSPACLPLSLIVCCPSAPPPCPPPPPSSSSPHPKHLQVWSHHPIHCSAGAQHCGGNAHHWQPCATCKAAHSEDCLASNVCRAADVPRQGLPVEGRGLLGEQV